MVDRELSSANVPSQAMAMPVFVYNRADGVFVDLPKLSVAEGGFERFVERLFESGARFTSLNYDLFLKLLYDEEWLSETKVKTPSLKVAESIVRFLPERQALYRKVKMLPGDLRAEYMFEPVSIEESYQVPLYGDPEGGIAPIVGYETKTRDVATKLDFDEMVTDMWLKGVKFGLREEAIRKTIASGETVRLPLALHIDPTPSRDAEIIEVCADLHRDNSPKLLANGKADLSVYKNRFPHVKQGTRLLKKVPRILGKPGRKVTGEAIEPDMPKDLDLHPLSSRGTSIEQGTDGEYVVATMDGFISIDTRSNSISITEKIETMEGISAKTTGDLALAVDEFIEHGEVQEGRTVKGKHMTFMSDVFGNVLSDDGNIVIAGNLSGGKVESKGGNVTLRKRASRAVVLARSAELNAGQCESSTLVGKVVRVEHAVNCEIVADELYADVVEGCIIAGKLIRIRSSGERRGAETSVTLVVPDDAVINQRIAGVRRELDEARGLIIAKIEEIETLKAEPEFAKFMALHGRIASGALKLSPEQSTNWRKLVEKNAATLQQLTSLKKDADALSASVKDMEETLASMEREQQAMGKNISCTIEHVEGHTVGQTMRMMNGLDSLSVMSGGTIRTTLQTMDGRKERVFYGDDGSIEWKFEKPAA
ncbi:MAG TPA: flagellar assembly protein A [Gallionella sp.]|nr:flagellar assembly protein A [Gallionella sp.]